MRIQKNTLQQFIKETRLDKEHIIGETIIAFTKKGLMVNHLTEDTTTLVRATLNADAFSDYEEHGKIGILYYYEIENILSTLKGDMVTIKKEDTRIILDDGQKHVVIDIADPENIQHKGANPDISHENTVVLSPTVFSDIEKTFSFSMAKSEPAEITFEAKPEGNGKLELSYGTRYKYTETVELDSDNEKNKIVEQAKCRFGTMMFNTVRNLQGDFLLGLKTNKPAVIHRETDEYVIDVVIAPKVVDEE